MMVAAAAAWSALRAFFTPISTTAHVPIMPV
jgi:hypothetical protein